MTLQPPLPELPGHRLRRGGGADGSLVDLAAHGLVLQLSGLVLTQPVKLVQVQANVAEQAVCGADPRRVRGGGEMLDERVSITASIIAVIAALLARATEYFRPTGLAPYPQINGLGRG